MARRGTHHRNGKEEMVIVLGPTGGGGSLAKLRNSVDGALVELGYQVDDVMQAVIDEVGKEGAAILRQTSPKRTGKYRKGWVYEKNGTYKGRKMSGVIRNKTRPQLTHLLEYGHPIVRNKKTVGHAEAMEHIGPVQRWCEAELERRLKQKL